MHRQSNLGTAPKQTWLSVLAVKLVVRFYCVRVKENIQHDVINNSMGTLVSQKCLNILSNESAWSV